jgi:regulator of protease activity HflC (stomatin/prohibitin superfamily)
MKKEKNFNMLILSLCMIIGISSCSFEDVPEGHKGVLVKRPYIFGSSGVEILNNDRHTIAESSTLILVNTQPMKIKESFDDMTPKDDTPVDFDIYFSIVLDESKLDILYSKFGLKYYDNNLQQEFRELIRNKCKQYDMKSLTNDSKVSDEICEYVKLEGNKIIRKLKIPVTLQTVNMGKVNPPSSVIQERERTASAKQREQTIIQETKNQIERQNSERERAKADKAYQDALTLTKDEYIRLQELKVKEIGYSKAKEITIIEGGNTSLNKNIR